MRKARDKALLLAFIVAAIMSWASGPVPAKAEDASRTTVGIPVNLAGGCLQVVGVVTYWKYQFPAPQGYWQCPGEVSWHGAAPETLLVTFFASKEDLRPPVNGWVPFPVHDVFQFAMSSKVYGSADDYFSRYQTYQMRVREIPEPLGNRFQQLKNWSCKYMEPTGPYRAFYSITCFSVDEKTLKLSVAADTEEKVLNKAWALWDMIASFKENK